MSRMHPHCATDVELENLIPSKGPDKKPGWAGEQAVYKFFRDYMPGDWDVFFNALFDKEEIEKHQLDFWVVIPNVGMINIDAKGKGYVEADGHIYLESNGKRIPDDIYGQASRAAKSINDFMLKDISSEKPWGEYGCLVLFAFSPVVARATEHDGGFSLMGANSNPQGVARDLVKHILEKRMNNFPTLHKCFTSELRTKVIRTLSREERPATVNTHFLEWDKVSEQMLTQPQQLVFRRLLKNSRCHVKGAAGTGKSLIAIALAKQYAQLGKDVLYVCYNHALAEKLNRKIGTFPERKRLFVTNFDRIQSVFGKASEFGDYKKRPRAEWDRHLEDTLPNLVSRSGRFDVLLVDEAQDLSQKELFILLSCLHEERKIVLFSDAEQTIFSYESTKGWNYDEKSLFQGEEVAELRLDVNYRNAATIHGVMQPYEDNQEIVPYWNAFTMETPPVPVQHITMRDVHHKLSEVLEHAAMNQIAFLTTKWQLIESYQNWQDKLGHQIRFVGGPKDESPEKQSCESIPEWERGKGILKATVQGFKGLDADIVFLFGINLPKIDNELKYVGLSRAKYELYVVE